MEDIADRFARALRRLAPTRAERLAKLPGISARALQYWETGKPPPTIVTLIRAGVLSINEPPTDAAGK